MDSKNLESDENYERLNETIMRAITSSKEVRALLLEFKAKGLLKRSTVLNFLLGLEDLFASTHPRSSFDPDYKFELPVEEKMRTPEFPNPTTGKRTKFSPLEDSMSENEKLFEAYYREKFDIKRWLKIARIKF